MMFREHVLLSLSLLIGMLFIIDLYIAAIYLNKTNAKNRFRENENLNIPNQLPAFEEPKPTPLQPPIGRDTEFGFDLQFSPQDASFFKYFYYPYQGHLTVLLPADKLRTISANEQDILDYVVKKILEETSYQQNLQRYYSRLSVGSNYLREEVQEGVVWVNNEILRRISATPIQPYSYYRRKRNLPTAEMYLTSLKVLRTTEEKLNRLLHTPAEINLPVRSSLSDITADWENWEKLIS